MTVQATDWASLLGAVIDRDDAITTVGMLSIGSIFFQVDFPVDALCRVKVVFPSDMPLTADLTKITSSGVIQVTNKAPTTISVATNTFTLDGCTSYS